MGVCLVAQSTHDFAILILWNPLFMNGNIKSAVHLIVTLTTIYEALFRKSSVVITPISFSTNVVSLVYSPPSLFSRCYHLPYAWNIHSLQFAAYVYLNKLQYKYTVVIVDLKCQSQACNWLFYPEVHCIVFQ